MYNDISLCSNEECPYRSDCGRGIDSQGLYHSSTPFKLKDGKCMFFLPKSADLDKYYQAIPVPMVIDIEVIVEPEELMVSRCYGCGEPTSEYAQCRTKDNAINICKPCLVLLDDVSFKSKSFSYKSLVTANF